MKSIYDLTKYRLLRYPLLLLFLLDFLLTWRFTAAELRGDTATNVSSVQGIILSKIGKVMGQIKKVRNC